MWSVAITKLEASFQAAEKLRSEGLGVFLPYTIEKSRVQVKTAPTRACPRPRAVFKAVETKKPRWPGYVFARTPDDEALALVLENYRVISFGGAPAQVQDHVISHLKQGCDEDGRLVKFSSLYNVGDILRFIAPSPFEGRSGAVTRLDETTITLDIGRVVTTRYAEVAPIL